MKTTVPKFIITHAKSSSGPLTVFSSKGPIIVPFGESIIVHPDGSVESPAATLGRKGGKVKSQKKTAAARKNAQRPRPNRRKGK